jgi:flagellar hook capping protein FlgD
MLMRTRLLMVGITMALGTALVTATPAAASHTVLIEFPGGSGEFYSPFGGPATITFTIDPTDVDATFSLRLRPAGGTAVHTETAFVDAQDADGTKVVDFNWPAVSVNNPRTYEVVVYRIGGPLVQSQSFLLRPRLVTITSVSPTPFFPWIDDLYRDETHVRFALAADAAAEARVYRPKTTGKCCGALVRNDGLGNLSAGENSWDWDGRNNNGDNLTKGDYFARVWADDGSAAPVMSKATKVAIARTYRATKSKSKTASAYHHVGPVTPLVLGGGCIVFRSNGNLQILCQGAKVSVYWGWGLSSVERIERASFVLDTVEGCPRSIRRTGHTKHVSSFTMNEDLVGASGDCHLVAAKITYSYPKAS